MVFRRFRESMAEKASKLTAKHGVKSYNSLKIFRTLTPWDPVRASLDAIFAKRSFDPSCEVVSNGLACFGAVAKAGCAHQVVKTGSGAAAARTPGFNSVNTALGNIKAAMMPWLLWAGIGTTSMPYRLLKLAGVYV